MSSSYPAPDAAVPVSAGMIVAVPEDLLASPLRNGCDTGTQTGRRWSSGGRRRSARAAAVFLKVAAVTEAVVTRGGQVRAEGRPHDHAPLGPVED